MSLSLFEFEYVAQTDAGLRMSGVVQAPDGAGAVAVLEGMRLRVLEVTQRREKARPMRGGDFLAFNQQLAEFAKAGMPIETGVRLAAASARRGRLAKAIALVAAEIKRGAPVEAAFDKHRRQFPPLYGRLIEAGLRGGDLHGVLLEFGPQLESQDRLSAALWRSVAYPLFTFCALLIVLSFIGWQLAPRLVETLVAMRMKIPLATRIVLAMSRAAPYFAAAAIIGSALAMALLRRGGVSGRQRFWSSRLLLPLPLVGPVVRYALVSRWLVGLRIGLAGNLPLPQAVRLAGEATASATLRREGEQWAAQLQDGGPSGSRSPSLLPETVTLAIELSPAKDRLPQTLRTLSDLYDRLAELRTERIPAIVTPLLMMLIALLISVTALGLLLPVILYLKQLMQSTAMSGI